MPLLPGLLQKGFAAGTLAIALVVAGIFPVKALVILLGRVKRFGRQDGGDYRPGKNPAFLQLFFGLLCLSALILIGVKDGADIAAAAIGKLAARIGRVNLLPVGIEELFEADALRIVDNLHHLDMAAFAVILVGRVFGAAARIAGCDRQNPFQLVKGRFHAPETAACKHGLRLPGRGRSLRCKRESAG